MNVLLEPVNVQANGATIHRFQNVPNIIDMDDELNNVQEQSLSLSLSLGVIVDTHNLCAIMCHTIVNMKDLLICAFQ